MSVSRNLKLGLLDTTPSCFPTLPSPSESFLHDLLQSKSHVYKRYIAQIPELRKANTPKAENYEMIEANLIEAIDLTLMESVIANKGH